MDYVALTAYFAALVAFTASPGPLVAVLMARSLGNDMRGAAAFATGLCVGEVVVLGAVLMGLGTLAESRPEWFAIVKYAGIAYLLWLAFRIWNDSSTLNAKKPRSESLIASLGAGFALCVGTPSIFISYILFLPMVVPAGGGSIEHLGVVVAVSIAAVVPVYFGGILLARQLKRIASSPKATNLMSRITAAVIAATALWMLAA